MGTLNLCYFLKISVCNVSLNKLSFPVVCTHALYKENRLHTLLYKCAVRNSVKTIKSKYLKHLRKVLI